MSGPSGFVSQWLATIVSRLKPGSWLTKVQDWSPIYGINYILLQPKAGLGNWLYTHYVLELENVQFPVCLTEGSQEQHVRISWTFWRIEGIIEEKRVQTTHLDLSLSLSLSVSFSSCSLSPDICMSLSKEIWGSLIALTVLVPNLYATIKHKQ